MEPYTKQPGSAQVELHRGGHTTRWQRRDFVHQPTEWVRSGTLADVLAGLAAGTRRAYIVGPMPDGEPPDGWSEDGHYLSLSHPIRRYVRAGWAAGGGRLDLHLASSWFGHGSYTAGQCSAAWAETVRQVRGVFGPGATCLATPATTGRMLFAASIPYGVEWDTLSAEHTELIRSTAGQGRIEWFPPQRATIAGLHVYDGRLMYGALCRELGTAPVIHDRHPEPHTFDEFRPARYRVSFRVPRDWSHVGLLPVMGGGGRWEYPVTSGRCYSTWVDGVELWLAQSHGWDYRIRESLLFTRGRGAAGRPLDAWAARLCRAYATSQVTASDFDPVVRAMVGRAIRAILLHGIGAFATGPQIVTRSVPIDQAASVPPGALQPRMEGDRIVWAERTEPAWPAMSHPEWAAQIWARARVRLLSGPGSTGALHVPRSNLLMLDTDALYLTKDPGWPDDGIVGRLRPKYHREGPIWAPTNRSALYRMTKEESGADQA